MVEPTKVVDKTDGKVGRAASVAKPRSKPSPDTDLEQEMNRLSLAQAVRDFEIANARVVDLTQRLISANERVVALQRQCDEAQTAFAELNSLHAAMRGSQAFRLADKVWTLRNLLRR